MSEKIYRSWKPIEQSEGFDKWFADLLRNYKTSRYFRKGHKLYANGVLGIEKWIIAQRLPEEQEAMKNLLLDAMISANKACPGSNVWLPLALSDKLIVSESRYGSSKTYASIVASLAHFPESIELFNNVIDLTGPLTKITVRLGDYSEPFIRYKNSYSFPIKLCPMFVQTLGRYKGIELSNPETIMIEGAPATLAEIEPLIYRFVESQRPVVIIARSFPEEVSATLATNFKTGKLKILPIVYGTDVNSVNMAADMITVTGGELISVHFGDVISAAVSNNDKYGSIDRLEVTENGIDIDSSADTSRQIKYLIEKLESLDSDEEALEEIIGNRIYSLTNDSIVVYIPKKSPEIHEELDAMIKTYSAFVTSGMSKTQYGWLPTSFVRTVSKIADTTLDTFNSISGFLLEQKRNC